MGRDKALLEVDGTAMARRVADALLAAGAAEVLAVGGDLDALRGVGLDARPDGWPGDGPLPATLTALDLTGHEVVVVLACDLVAPDPTALRRLVDELDTAPGALLAIPRDDAGELQWTHAAWRRAAADALRVAWAAGARSLKRAADAIDRVELDGLPAAALADADSPEDLPG
jgi:molybdopterin-guanine dinucleotide biosynthesis protein A